MEINMQADELVKEFSKGIIGWYGFRKNTRALLSIAQYNVFIFMIIIFGFKVIIRQLSI